MNQIQCIGCWGCWPGLLMNPNVRHPEDGLKPMVNKLEPSASLRALRGQADSSERRASHYQV